jgi:hypothetical protein
VEEQGARPWAKPEKEAEAAADSGKLIFFGQRRAPIEIQNFDFGLCGQFGPLLTVPPSVQDAPSLNGTALKARRDQWSLHSQNTHNNDSTYPHKQKMFNKKAGPAVSPSFLPFVLIFHL